MKILVVFDFDDVQMEEMTRMVCSHGDHHLVRVQEEDEAVREVCEEEPLPPASPLWSAPNPVLRPHRAGGSQHRPRKTFEFFRANLDRYLKGEELLNVIDKKRGY